MNLLHLMIKRSKQIIFGVLMTVVIPAQAQHADINILTSIHVHRNQSLDPGMQFISNSEYVVGFAVPVLTCAIGLTQKNTKTLQKGFNMSMAVLFNTATTYVLKHAINRPRPATTYAYIQPYENDKYLSMPSGHTSNAFCIATSATLQTKKWYVALPAYTWAGVVGYSRMHLGMHYPSDVAVGALVGAGSAYITYYVNKQLKKKFEKKYVGKFFF